MPRGGGFRGGGFGRGFGGGGFGRGFGGGGFGRGGWGGGWGRGWGWGGRGLFGPRWGFGFRPFFRPWYGGWGYGGWFGAPWGGGFLTETALLLLMGATAFKISQDDAQRIHEYTGRDFNDMSETELADAMRRLGIQQMALSPDERELIVKNRSQMAGTPPEKSKDYNPADVIRELKRLLDEGIITQEEYEARKAKALDDLTG